MNDPLSNDPTSCEGRSQEEIDMWVFTKFGFFSAVQQRDLPDVVIVRARVRGDLEAFWPKAAALIEQTEKRDLEFRTVMTRDQANPDFKASVTDHRRWPWHVECWSVMADMQDALRVSATLYRKLCRWGGIKTSDFAGFVAKQNSIRRSRVTRQLTTKRRGAPSPHDTTGSTSM